MSQRDLGASLGFSSGLVGQLEADISPPSRKFLERISERYNISSDWLLYGRGEQFLKATRGFAARDSKTRVEPVGFEKPYGGDFSYGGSDFQMIRRMDLSVSAGSGVIPVEGAESESLAFSTTWLGRNGINADLAVLVRVAGDSMAPGIPNGALAMVHLPERMVEREGIYAFNRGDFSFIKRLIPSGRDERGMPTSLVILSDNPAYPPQAVTEHEMNEINVVGRVRCVMTTL